MKVIAFDLSLTSSGWYDGTTVGTLVPPKGADRGTPRLDWIARAVMQKAAGVDLAVIEGYSYGSKNAAHQVGELGGVVRWHLWSEHVPIAVVQPSSRAMFATGKGNAGKEEVLAAAIRSLDYTGHSNDEADAMWLWQMAALHFGFFVRVPSSDVRARALSKVEWPLIGNPTIERKSPLREGEHHRA